MTQPERGAAIALLAALPLMKHAAIDDYMDREHLEALGEIVRED